MPRQAVFRDYVSIRNSLPRVQEVGHGSCLGLGWTERSTRRRDYWLWLCSRENICVSIRNSQLEFLREGGCMVASSSWIQLTVKSGCHARSARSAQMPEWCFESKHGYILECPATASRAPQISQILRCFESKQPRVYRTLARPFRIET